MHAATMNMKSIDPQMNPYVDSAAAADERTYATFNHLVGLAGLADGGSGFLGLIGSIITWRIKAKTSPFLDDHGRESVNFQISLLVYFFGGSLLLLVLTAITLGIGSILIPVGWLFIVALRLVGCIRGAMAANRGEYYRYPMCIRFISEPRN